MDDLNDTISAIATPIGEGGIGVIRISGPNAIEVGKALFRPASGVRVDELPARSAIYGRIIDPIGNEIVDDGIITTFHSPSSYTGENSVEISCHGGLIPLRKTLEMALKAGARLAEPGEFTKRAFLNGKMDLSQAEAVLDVIRSKTDEALRIARRQMDGFLSTRIRAIREALIALLAEIEASIDFPDDVDEPSTGEIIQILQNAIADAGSLLATADGGRIYREGLQAVIIGQPNVGKSSLLNALLRENRAIVTPIPGTTRDIIEEPINIKGIPVKAIDTAGVRDTIDIVERMGVDRTHITAEQADILLVVIDAEAGFTNEDRLIIDKYSTKPIIVVINKIDKVPPSLTADIQAGIADQLKMGIPHSKTAIVQTSITQGIGIDRLENEISSMAISGGVTSSSQVIVSNVRHKNALAASLASMSNALTTAENGFPIDLVSIDIRIAIEALGSITGETVTEDVIDKIFSEFCIGK